MNWFDTCEVVTGQVMSGRVSATAVNIAHICEPFDKAIKIAQKGNPTPERFADALGPMLYQQALNRAEAAQGIQVDWVSQLQQKAALFEGAQFFKKQIARMEAGEAPDAALMESHIARIYDAESRVLRLSDIEPDREELMLTGFLPIDEHFGGIVKNGLTTLGGRPGMGKSWLLMEIICSYLKQNKDAEAVIFTLEMSGGQLHHRVLDLMRVPKNIRERIWIVEDILSLSEIPAIASRLGPNCKIVGVDFAELVLDGNEEQSASTMARVYRTLARMGLRMKLSVLLLSQLSRAFGQSNTPGMSRLKWAGEAESGAIIMIHNPNSADSMVANDGDLPRIEGENYLAFVKSRFSFRNGTVYEHDGPFAVSVPIADYGGFKNQKGTKFYPIVIRS